MNTWTRPEESELLKETIRAHDPDGRWPGYTKFSARMTVAGGLWALKNVGGLFDDVVIEGDIHELRDTITPFPAAGSRGTFTPERTSIETLDGKTVDERRNPLAAFAGQERLTPWDAQQALYLASYANWNYFVAPFIYLTDGFTVRENGDWDEDGKTLRRLDISYPDGFPTHSQVQTIYLDDSGLIARLDYSVDILGDAAAAHYPTDYRSFDGIMVPTKRLVYVRNADGTPDRSAVSIDIAVADITFA